MVGYERGEEYCDTKLPSKVIPDSWIKLYWTVFGLLKPFSDLKVAELGCGPGAFSQILWQENLLNYLGIDFSGKCLELARKALPVNTFYRFEKYNLVTDHGILKLILKDYDVFVSIEVLEYIKDDFKVLDLIPSGKTVILTGPNRNDESHVRWFIALQEFIDRYSPFINYDFAGSMLANNKGKMFFIIRGTKK